MESHGISETSAYGTDQSPQKTMAVIVHLKVTQARCCIEPGDSSTELEEAEMDNDDAENERGPLNTVMKESCPILRRSSR